MIRSDSNAIFVKRTILSTKDDMKQHKNSFHEGRRYDCNLCNKSFIAKISLKNHISKIHNGESPKQIGCDQCTKVFVTTTGLRIHKMSHQGIRESCSFCDMTLSNKRELKKHISTIHSSTSEKHLCDLCKKSFTTEKNKKTHFRRAHLTKEPKEQ